ncbi:MAG: acetate--CoA ligase family protein [Planctomycetota bacterium]
MNHAPLDRLLNPRRVAVIGASDSPGAVGRAVMRNMLTSGFRGVVYPVNPRRESVQGVQAYPDIASVPHEVDLAVICTPSASVPGVVWACGEANVGGVMVISAGFGEAGESGKKLDEELRAAPRAFEHMRIIGPNCVGLIVPSIGLNASFGVGMPTPGSLAVLSQSGALCTAMLDWAISAGVGFSHFVSVGNMLDVSFGDLIDAIARDEHTDAIILYVESIPDARGFLSAARAFARGKPIVAYKAGRFAESAAAALSHTGAMAGEDVVFDAAFKRVGIERVYDMGDMFECAELLARQDPPTGPRLAVVTNAGGPGVIASDALIARGGTLAPLQAGTINELDLVLPPAWPGGNPIDIIGDATPERYERACAIALQDPGVDALLVMLSPQSMTDPHGAAEAVVRGTRGARCPVLAAWLGGESVRTGFEVLERSGIPTYSSPEQAVSAFMHLVSRASRIEKLHETPRDLHVEVRREDRDDARSFVESKLAEGSRVELSERATKDLLARYGIDVARAHPVANADEAVAMAREIGYPVAMKIRSAQISHKTDVGGVALDVRNDDAVRETFETMSARARELRPDATIDGVVVQRMVDRNAGVELIVGAKRDTTFGPVLMVGVGGVSAEVFQDREVGLPPLNEALARQMVESLKGSRLLKAWRGRPAMDTDSLIGVMLRLSTLVSDLPELAELDANPVLVTPNGAIALDARAVLTSGVECIGSHLAMTPYPEHLIARVGDASVRPLRPEDEQAWLAMLARCPREQRRAHLGEHGLHTPHWIGSRACTIDYDREIALVWEEGGAFSGEARLTRSPFGSTVRLSTLLDEDHAGPRVTATLLEHALRVARSWSCERVIADVADARVGEALVELGFIAELGGRLTFEFGEAAV